MATHRWEVVKKILTAADWNFQGILLYKGNWSHDVYLVIRFTIKVFCSERGLVTVLLMVPKQPHLQQSIFPTLIFSLAVIAQFHEVFFNVSLRMLLFTGASTPEPELYVPEPSVAHIPRYEKAGIASRKVVWIPSRTHTLHSRDSGPNPGRSCR